MKKLIVSLAAAAASLAWAGAAAAQTPADIARGKTLFTQQCGICHSVVAGQTLAGPDLNGVVGRKAGKNPKFPGYSKAMKASTLTWTAANLDGFLANPAGKVPGTMMPIATANAEHRRQIIAYLATVKPGK